MSHSVFVISENVNSKMCPAIMLARRRMVSEAGRTTMVEMNSMTPTRGFMPTGTPAGHSKWPK